MREQMGKKLRKLVDDGFQVDEFGQKFEDLHEIRIGGSKIGIRSEIEIIDE